MGLTEYWLFYVLCIVQVPARAACLSLSTSSMWLQQIYIRLTGFVSITSLDELRRLPSFCHTHALAFSPVHSSFFVLLFFVLPLPTPYVSLCYIPIFL
jgi:hypothetical protein